MDLRLQAHGNQLVSTQDVRATLDRCDELRSRPSVQLATIARDKERGNGSVINRHDEATREESVALFFHCRQALYISVAFFHYFSTMIRSEHGVQWSAERYQWPNSPLSRWPKASVVSWGQ